MLGYVIFFIIPGIFILWLSYTTHGKSITKSIIMVFAILLALTGIFLIWHTEHHEIVPSPTFHNMHEW